MHADSPATLPLSLQLVVRRPAPAATVCRGAFSDPSAACKQRPACCTPYHPSLRPTIPLHVFCLPPIHSHILMSFKRYHPTWELKIPEAEREVMNNIAGKHHAGQMCRPTTAAAPRLAGAAAALRRQPAALRLVAPLPVRHLALAAAAQGEEGKAPRAQGTARSGHVEGHMTGSSNSSRDSVKPANRCAAPPAATHLAPAQASSALTSRHVVCRLHSAAASSTLCRSHRSSPHGCSAAAQWC